MLIFVRNFGDAPQNIIDFAGSTYIRAQFLVEWTNNRVGVNWVNGSDNIAPLIYFQQVYGVL